MTPTTNTAKESTAAERPDKLHIENHDSYHVLITLIAQCCLVMGSCRVMKGGKLWMMVTVPITDEQIEQLKELYRHAT